MGLDRTIFIRKESDSNTRIETFRANPVVSSFQAPPGWAWGSPRGALGGYRTEKIQHFEGSGSQSDRGNTSLRRGRVAIGPRKRYTWRGPGRNRTEKARHSEGPGSQSGRENTALRGVRVTIGLRKHGTSRPRRPGGPQKHAVYACQEPPGRLRRPPRAPPGPLSRIRARWALWPANGAIRPKSRW